MFTTIFSLATTCYKVLFRYICIDVDTPRPQRGRGGCEYLRNVKVVKPLKERPPWRLLSFHADEVYESRMASGVVGVERRVCGDVPRTMSARVICRQVLSWDAQVNRCAWYNIHKEHRRRQRRLPRRLGRARRKHQRRGTATSTRVDRGCCPIEPKD